MYKFCSIYANSFAWYRVPGTKSPWRLLVAGQWAETKANAWSSGGPQVPLHGQFSVRLASENTGGVCGVWGMFVNVMDFKLISYRHMSHVYNTYIYIYMMYNIL